MDSILINKVKYISDTFSIYDGDELIYQMDASRLNNAKWYQKTLALLSKKYYLKFIDIVDYRKMSNGNN